MQYMRVRVPTLLLRKKIQRLFQDPENVFQQALHCIWWATEPIVHGVILHSTHLTKYIVHKDAIPTPITYEMPNISKFIATLFQQVRAQTWAYACWLIWTTSKFQDFPGTYTLISRTILIFLDFPGPGNFRKLNKRLSRIFQEVCEREPCT